MVPRRCLRTTHRNYGASGAVGAQRTKTTPPWGRRCSIRPFSCASSRRSIRAFSCASSRRSIRPFSCASSR
eukprot:366563-Chlamydomonas_euryale.AAC.1